MTTVLAADDVDFTRIVRPDDLVMWTQGAGEPLPLIERLFQQRHETGPFRVFLAGSYAASVRPEHADVVTVLGLGAVGTNRALCDAGRMQILPSHFSELPHLIRTGPLRADVVLTQLSEPDAGGRFSVGAVNGFVAAAMAGARTVIADVNAQAPWTHSRTAIDPERLDLITRSDRPLITVSGRAPTEAERVVAANLASFIEDGRTVQLGIGAVPAAVAETLRDRTGLGVHSGVVGDAVLDLIEAGAVTNAGKPLDTGCTVAGALAGSQRLYQFADHNPQLRVEPLDYTHNYGVLSRLDGLIAVNSAVEVDLTGQVGAEVAGRRYVGTVGGHGDFVRGALAAGGRSLIGLTARTRAGASRIVVTPRSGVVTTPRADSDVVATEFGVAQLRGQPIAQRVQRMIAIAHPEDREVLEREARASVIGYR